MVVVALTIILPLAPLLVEMHYGRRGLLSLLPRFTRLMKYLQRPRREHRQRPSTAQPPHALITFTSNSLWLRAEHVAHASGNALEKDVSRVADTRRPGAPGGSPAERPLEARARTPRIVGLPIALQDKTSEGISGSPCRARSFINDFVFILAVYYRIRKELSLSFLLVLLEGKLLSELAVKCERANSVTGAEGGNWPPGSRKVRSRLSLRERVGLDKSATHFRTYSSRRRVIGRVRAGYESKLINDVV
ncbi:hypothetical protein EVAR_80915_1 [Eumeta japonica]|uniref:Uncharacterized protein n=1 Tax=Eumeta variegata TaxID=151549 RepID=A0A4C1V085_EUMVA|nr:hypothetical protein EVAR_80915_1 [Eumeta japonica]